MSVENRGQSEVELGLELLDRLLFTGANLFRGPGLGFDHLFPVVSMEAGDRRYGRDVHSNFSIVSSRSEHAWVGCIP